MRTDQLKQGLTAPICLTWELTYGCNLACVHCLSSSGRRDPDELSTAEAERVVDELAAMQVFYVNIGGGEPLVRRDFFDLLEHAVASGVGVKFSTNGALLTRAMAARLATTDYVDVQVSLDGASKPTNDAVRGAGSYTAARRAMDHLAEAGFGPFKISVVVTRDNVAELDDLEALALGYGAQLRVTRLRPSGRGAATWRKLHPTASQQRHLYDWLSARPHVLTGDSFFHLSGLGEPLPGLNLCGAGRVVCLIDPVGDVYACPFVLHDEFKAGSVRGPGGFAAVWRSSRLFEELRAPQSAGAARPAACSTPARAGACGQVLHRAPLDGPDPECVLGHGEAALAGVAPGAAPSPARPLRRAPAPGACARRTRHACCPSCQAAAKQRLRCGWPSHSENAPGRRWPRTRAACSPSPWARPSNMGRTCPWTPTPGSRSPWPGRSPTGAATCWSPPPWPTGRAGSTPGSRAPSRSARPRSSW